jgi:hypothetical protein
MSTVQHPDEFVYTFDSKAPNERRRQVRFSGKLAFEGAECEDTYTMVYVTNGGRIIEKFRLKDNTTSVHVYQSFSEFEAAQTEPEREMIKDMLAAVAEALGEDWIEEVE